MDVVITTFSSPFSFFCIVESDSNEVTMLDDTGPQETVYSSHSKKEISDVNHGQYVAVFWRDKWARGLVTMESQFLIWLIDYGIYIRPNDKTVYIDLPAEYKKYPTKVFEASIHGVAPYDRVLTDDCQIKNEISTTWSKGAIEKVQTLLKEAKAVFVPVALLTTKFNDVVIGDLYIKYPSGKLVNIISELETWPVFLERNPETYIQNLAVYYTSRRKHRNSLLKPEFPNFVLPSMTLGTSLSTYTTFCENAIQLEASPSISDDDDDGATVVDVKDQKNLRLTPSEIEHYSEMYVTIAGVERNVLHILLDKIRDLNMCERYKDHDVKSVGRANVRSWSRID